MDRITVIIPNHNGEKFLGPCLDSILGQTRRPERVIVVDNGSTDRSRAIAEGHALKPEVMALPANLGFAAAVNRGIAAADTEIVALLNNDAEADPRWVEAGLRAAQRFPEAMMFSSLMLDYYDRDRVDSAGDVYPREGRPRARAHGERAAGYDHPAEVFGACGGAGFYRRALFDEIGLFEESFFAYLEDVDLAFRARAAGHPVLFAPEAVVYHRGAGTELGDRRGGKAVDSSLRVQWISRNRLRLISRNFSLAMLARLFPRLAAGFVKSAAYHLFISRKFGSFAQGAGEALAFIPADRAHFRSRIAPGLSRPRLRRALGTMIREGERPWEA